MAVEKTKLTKAGKQRLEEELRNLIDVERENVKRQLAEARAQGDLSENADYDAARAKQAEVEGRIKQIEATLANSELIDESKANNKKVALGCSVTLRFIESGKTDTYKIVGSVESDPMNKMISNACPLGEAVIGKVVGDIVEVKAIKTYNVEIVKIEVK